MNNTANNYNNKQDLSTLMIVFFIVICLYGLGVYLHIRIIMVSKKEKNLTWKIDISHSVLVLVLHAHAIYLWAITYLTPDLAIYTGDWLCYISKPVVYYTMLYLAGHSMSISMIKYVIIVYEEKFRHKKDEIKSMFFWINIIHPVVQIAMKMVLNPYYFYEFDGLLPINDCLRKSNVTKTTLYAMCDFAKPMQSSSFEYVVYIFRRTICTIQVAWLISIAFNFFDMFFYSRIFSYMHR